MKRETTQTIWRTVVFAGAMLGTPGCSKGKPAATTPPTNTATEPDKQTEATTNPDPAAPLPSDPCAGQERPRGTDADGGGGVGRGFVLS